MRQLALILGSAVGGAVIGAVGAGALRWLWWQWRVGPDHSFDYGFEDCLIKGAVAGCIAGFVGGLWLVHRRAA